MAHRPSTADCLLVVVQMELPATAAALERVGQAGVWVPPTDAIRQLLVLVKQGEQLGRTMH